MARLGADVAMFGCVGDDDNGRKMVENLIANGVKADQVRTVKGVPTGIAIITIGDNDNTIIVVAGANSKVDRAYVDSVKEDLLGYDMVVLQHEIPLDTVHYIVDLCSEHNIPVVLNPAPAAAVPAEIIEKVTWLTPNEHEAVLIFGEDKTAEELLRMYPGKLLITQGSRGVSVGLSSEEILTVPVRPAKNAYGRRGGESYERALKTGTAVFSEIQHCLVRADTNRPFAVSQNQIQSSMSVKGTRVC